MGQVLSLIRRCQGLGMQLGLLDMGFPCAMLLIPYEIACESKSLETSYVRTPHDFHMPASLCSMISIDPMQAANLPTTFRR